MSRNAYPFVIDDAGAWHPQRGDTAGAIATIGGLSIPAHDYVAMAYTGTNLTEVVYKTGGASGATVATLVLDYNVSDQLVSITKS